MRSRCSLVKHSEFSWIEFCCEWSFVSSCGDISVDIIVPFFMMEVKPPELSNLGLMRFSTVSSSYLGLGRVLREFRLLARRGEVEVGVPPEEKVVSLLITLTSAAYIAKMFPFFPPLNMEGEFL